MVHLYFERVHPYIPLLHRVAFSKKLSKGTASTFLLQCIFTSVAPYMSTQLLTESGHSNRATAQKSFFTKAQALYDMSTEISQLHRLQGSLILTSSYFSFGLDKDCRFWLYNAVRIALQVGIHRKQILSQLNSEAARLFQKMFWILYSRDIVMVMAGRLNVRALDDRYCDVPPLTEDDWEEESEDERVCYGLSPISTVHRLYIVHSSKLDRICTHRQIDRVGKLLIRLQVLGTSNYSNSQASHLCPSSVKISIMTLQIGDDRYLRNSNQRQWTVGHWRMYGYWC